MPYVNFEPNIRMNLSSPTYGGRAYHVIRSPKDVMQCPVEFHISKPRESEDGHHIKWTMRDRVDLHREVIMQAMLRDLLCTTGPHTRRIAESLSGIMRHIIIAPRPWVVGISPPPTGLEGVSEASIDDKHPLLVKPSRERQMKVERLSTPALKKEAAPIGKKFERYVETRVYQRLKKFNGGPTAPLSEGRSKMQERMRTIIERTIPEIETLWSADTATASPKTMDAVQNDPLD